MVAYSAVVEVESLGLVVLGLIVLRLVAPYSAVVEVESLGLVVLGLVAPYSALIYLVVVISVYKEVGCLATLGVAIRYRAIIAISILCY